MNSANPFLGMQTAHNRQYPQGNTRESNENAKIRGPDSERLSMEQVIRAYTMGGAYQLRMDGDLGSIEPGKLADLAILDRDLFTIDRYDIRNTRPVAVFMEGDMVRGKL